MLKRISSVALVIGSLVAVPGCLGTSDTLALFLSLLISGSGTPGAVDGNLADARFNNPVNVAVWIDGSIYVCDYDNDRIRQIRGNSVTTLVQGADFNRPFGIAIASDGTLYVQTDGNDLGVRDSTTGTIWRIDRSTGARSVVRRNLGRPRGIAVRPDGQIVMANLTQHQIQILNPISGDLTNLAGSGDPGFDNGTGTAAKLNRPYGLALLPDGDMLVADQSNNRIRRVTASGVVSTFAGTGAIGSGNGNRTSATFNGPQDIKYNQLDNALYVADTLNHIIRKIDGDTVTTIAGNGMPGYVEGIGTAASFFGLEGIGVDLRNNDLIVADGSRGEDEPYHRVRRVNL